MAEVTWQGRDALGRIIDIEGDTDTMGTPPGPSELSVGGAQTIRLLEFPFAFDDAFVNSDYQTVHTIENDGYIVYSAFITLSSWGGDGAAEMSWEAVRDGQITFLECTDVAAGGAGGAALPREFPATSRFAMPLTAGQTIGIGVWSVGELTSGSTKLMVLLAEPAA